MATATIPTQAYPPKYHLPESEVAQIGTVGVKTMHKQIPGQKMASVLVLFESAMTDERYLPKKMVGRELHVYPDMDEAAAASPFLIGDTRAATNYYRGRHARRWSRRRILPRADREDRLVYPFLSIGRRSDMAIPKEKELTSTTDLIKEKQVPKYLVNKQFVPELDGEVTGFNPGYHEPHYPIIDVMNPDPKAMQFSYNPHQYERRLVHVPYLRTIKMRWWGRLFDRRNGQKFWPTRSISCIPRSGHGPYNWGSYKDSFVANEEAVGQELADFEKSKDEYYDRQPSQVPHLATFEEFLPDVLLDEISEQEWLEGDVEDGMEGYIYGVPEDYEAPAKDVKTEDLEHADYYTEEKMPADEYDRLVKARPRGSRLDPSKVVTDDPEDSNYYWELMTPPSKRKGKGTGTPQPARRTPERKTPTVGDQFDKAWVPLSGHKMMWEYDTNTAEVAVGGKPDSSFASHERFGYERLNEETK